MNLGMITLLIKIGLGIGLFAVMMISESWSEIKFVWTCTCEEVKNWFKERNITKLFSFRGKH